MTVFFRILCFSAVIIYFSSGILHTQTFSFIDYRHADSLIALEKWDGALDAFRFLSEQNDYNGYYWSNYGYCLYQKQRYNEAIACYKKAIDIGFESATQSYNIACCYSLMNKPEETVSWLHRSAGLKMTSLEEAVRNDRDFDPVRQSELFRTEVIPAQDMFKTREDGWKTDIQFFRKRMEETHYNIFGRVSEKQWNGSIDNLIKRLDKLDNYRIMAELYKLTHMIGDGHTTVQRPDNDKISVSVFPISLFLFEDGLYVTSASKQYGDLAGKKVIRYGNTEANVLMEKLREVTPIDNEFGLKWRSMRLLTFAGLMYGLGIIDKPDEAEITVEGGAKYMIKGEHLVNNDFPEENSPKKWVKAFDTTQTPLYLRDPYNLYWFEYLPEKNMVYMQYNGIQEKKDEPLQAFVNKVFDFIDSNNVKYFVLDLRFNGGGNSFLNKILVHSIIKHDKINTAGRFFTIIGRNTFSAAMNLTGDLERQTNVIFAGEPTGSSPNFVGESNIIILPYSGIRVACSSRYWQNYLSDDYRKWIAPQLGVKYFYSDFKKGSDPAMEEILKFISQ